MTQVADDWKSSATRPLTASEVTAVAEAEKERPATSVETDLYREPHDLRAVRQLVSDHWPSFPAFVDEVRAMLGRPPHFVLVRNIPLTEPTSFLMALTSSLGTPVEPHRTAWARMIQVLRPEIDPTRDGYGFLNESLHTDSSDWPRPNDVTCLLCVRPSQDGGGRSLVLPVESFVADLNRVDADLPGLLSRVPMPWLLGDSFDGKFTYQPILLDGQVRWHKYTIGNTIAAGASLPPELTAALPVVEEVLTSVSMPIEVHLDGGDLLIFDNKRCLHARTPIADMPHSDRLMFRVKVDM